MRNSPDVKRRLFQSVQGHPFFILLTKDILKQELDEFARFEFKSKLVDVNKETLDEAWNKGVMYEEKTEEDWQVQRATIIRSCTVQPVQSGRGTET